LLPAYLFLCLMLGGSSRAAWGSVALQAIAPWLIVYAALADRSVEQRRSSRLLLGFLAAWFALVLIQLAPLPPGVWTQLPGRESLAEGYRELGYALPWLPLAMAPYDLLRALVALLPPAAVLLMMLRLQQNEAGIAGAIVIAAMAGVTLGALQIGGGGPDQSPWYPYEITNVGAVGFFREQQSHGITASRSVPLCHGARRTTFRVRQPQQFRDALGCARRGRVPDDRGRCRVEPLPRSPGAVHSGSLRVDPASEGGLQA